MVCLIDDVLFHGKTQEEHDERLYVVLRRLQESGLTLNREKCIFSSSEVKFLCQILSEAGIRPDPEKVAAIQKLQDPNNVHELCRFLGMVNHLTKFTPNLADMTKSLRDLLSKESHWCWGEPQKTAFQEI